MLTRTAPEQYVLLTRYDDSEGKRDRFNGYILDNNKLYIVPGHAYNYNTYYGIPVNVESVFSC